VHVFLFGRSEPIEIGFVEVRKIEGGAEAVRLEALNDVGDRDQDGSLQPADYWIHTCMSAIAHVEIGFREKSANRPPVGFGYSSNSE
jgi:hypothetical protein